MCLCHLEGEGFWNLNGCLLLKKLVFCIKCCLLHQSVLAGMPSEYACLKKIFMFDYPKHCAGNVLRFFLTK